MDDKSLLQKYSLMISFMLPEGMLDWFEIIKIEETDNDKPCHELDVLYPKVLNVYLKERDNREGEELGLVANGFTEPTEIHDYPVRSRNSRGGGTWGIAAVIPKYLSLRLPYD